MQGVGVYDCISKRESAGESKMNRCINLTKKMHQCKSRATYLMADANGTTSLHCSRHWFFFYGRWGGLGLNIVEVKRV